MYGTNYGWCISVYGYARLRSFNLTQLVSK